jgi:copper chaperone CopZ
MATYIVSGMTCGHCVQAVRTEVAAVPGVTGVDVDLDTKEAVVHGDTVDDAAVRAAIVAAGYAAAR